jgi:hypothetical protein
VLFPVQAGGGATDAQLDLPAGVSSVIVTGLIPPAQYSATFDGTHLHIERGVGNSSDADGVLVLGRG